MPNRQDIEAQIAELQKQLEGADDGTELWIEDERGRKTKLTGPHAKKWLRNLGLDDDDDAGQEGDEDPEGRQDPPPAGGSSVWGRKAKLQPCEFNAPGRSRGRRGDRTRAR